ncbi:hypothetical protein NQ318_007627 [Aromia moschata]|uniref:Protein FAM50 homolog n=1 Tax=Aromia moschata TaxID=1265417 RepID=A0AAV8YF98_9CUCU|nr:hypothetical protein NQ318_007627 [Aromia moschata]
MAHYKGAASEAGRAMQLMKKREKEMQDLELRKKRIEEDLKLNNIENKFATHYDAVEQQLKSSTIGLVTLDEMKAKQENIVKEREKKLAQKQAEKEREKQRQLEAKQAEKNKQKKQFLQKVLELLRKEFSELKTVMADQLMYVKEDLILPHHYTFYDFIVTKKEESHAGKVLLRSWYERNKHIFPASRWEPYDPTKSLGFFDANKN